MDTLARDSRMSRRLLAETANTARTLITSERKIEFFISMQHYPFSLRIGHGDSTRHNATQSGPSYNRVPISPRNECDSNQAESALSHTVRIKTFFRIFRRDSTQLPAPAHRV